MQHASLSQIVLAVLVGGGVFGGCLFDTGRGSELAPGDVVGSLFEAPDGTRQAAAFARVAVGSRSVWRADRDGAFVVTGLGLGAWNLRFDDDANGDGWPEASARRQAAITWQSHEGGLFEEGEEGPTWVELGDIELLGVVEVAGRVTREDDGEPVAGALVYVVRDVELPAFSDEDGVERELTTQGPVEAVTATDVDGRYRFAAISSGTFTLVAFADDGAGGTLSAPGSTVDAAPSDPPVGGSLTSLRLDVTPANRPVRIELSPPVSDRVKVVFTRPGEPPPLNSLDDFDGPGTYPGSDNFALPAPVGVWDVHLKTESGLSGVLFAQVSPDPDPTRGFDGQLVTWGVALLTEDVLCASAGDERDCDHDDVPGLPIIDGTADPDHEIWRACAPSCADAWGTDQADQTCVVDGTTYDCDDDGDGQPDVTEPPACYGPAGGRDGDGDGLCDLADPFPQCSDNDPAASACAEDRADTFVPPTVREVFGGPTTTTPDAGPADAGPVDAGSVDAGSVDAGSVDAGSVDAGSVDAGSVDAGSVDAGA